MCTKVSVSRLISSRSHLMFMRHSFDADGNAVGGIEFTITVRGSVPGDSSLIKVQTLVMDAVEKTVNYVIQNY